MALPNNSTIYRTQNWENEYKRTRFGSADDLTKRQERQFNRFAKSKKGEAARLAYDKAETERFNNSVDSAVAARKAGMQKAASDFTATLASKAAAAPAPAPAPAPAATPALVLKNASHWNQVAGQYGFKDYNAVAAWQKENGLEADGKFGSASYAKWAQLNPDKVGTAPVIKPRVVTPQTSVTPTADQTARLVPEGYVELSRPDGTTFLQRQHPRTSTDTPEAAPFDLMGYAEANGLNDFYNHGGKKFVRHDPFGAGDYLIGEDGKMYKAGRWGSLGEEVNSSNIGSVGSDAYNNYQKVFKALNSYKGIASNKQGGIMNRINYFQQGGAAPQQQDMQAQVVALVQAAMQGDQKATQTVNQIMEAAKAGDQQAVQIAQIMEQVIKELQGQATSAKWGTKLGYIRSLKYAKGGKTCPACEKKVEMKACGGKKAKKRYFGGLV